ncbi:hypothetical protein [Thalassotalea crassostreae]|nr:hypothetical protein [Thalassotalea crassostreae]
MDSLVPWSHGCEGTATGSGKAHEQTIIPDEFDVGTSCTQKKGS